jgi:hypothetical protein
MSENNFSHCQQKVLVYTKLHPVKQTKKYTPVALYCVSHTLHEKGAKKV